MKKQHILLTVAFLVLSIHSGFGQTEPYETINKSLETPVEPKLLWPMEEIDLIPELKSVEINVTYKLSFNDPNKSELSIDFNQFEKMVSAVYLKDQVSGTLLAEILENTISDEFKPVFEQTDGEDIFYMFSDGDKDQEEVYFLATSDEKYELLYFKYKPDTNEKERLQFQIQNVFNK
ncbi:hypothetical protein Belba_1401 [Belliella baltica DSM 15883]|uniref:Uncharacterized protein n=1 Tax=Belliella baltica (strain DSM 15883 / CIP 108006 / LMG 21964 / BA134) TaxID=866536 RepID=I3Z454_BELBD|nr:hypothetical protein [Belliella baltica]AFL84022.1 hypothetical protein Belba_1401 [Belliella baltica DSM 15883]